MYWFDPLWGNNGHGNGWVGMAPFGEQMTKINHRDNIMNVDPTDCEIMQFTGLHDKNGKEIYEGDIYHKNGGKGEIVFYNGCFCVKGGSSFSPLNFGCEEDYADIIVDDFVDTIEVIGNIHENPELL